MKATVLTPEQIERIHHASLTILERTGVQVPHDDMLRRYAALRDVAKAAVLGDALPGLTIVGAMTAARG
jgi:hypothetical protein